MNAQTASDSLVSSDLIVAGRFQSLFDSVHTVNLPPGFRCEVYYSAPNFHPRSLAIDPNGHIACSDMGAGIIYALLERSGTGVADTSIVLASGDGGAHGFAFYNSALYTAAERYVMKYEHPNAEGRYADSSRFIDNVPYLAEGVPNHYTRTILFDTIHKQILLSVGAPCNACRENDSNRAAILRLDLDGSHRSIYASGLRNAVGLTQDPMTGTVWAAVAERNSLGEDLPGDFVAKIEPGAFYGWPIAYGDHQWDDFNASTEYQALLPVTHADSVLVASMYVPQMIVPAHSTALGVAIDRATLFPSEYYGNAFIALHGSYHAADGRFIANGSSILRGAQSNGSWSVREFATGFLTDSLNYQRWARPCAVFFDSVGALYVASDEGGAHSAPAIYKIWYDPTFGVASNSAMPTARLAIVPDPVGPGQNVITVSLYGAHTSGTVVFEVRDAVGRLVRRSSDRALGSDFTTTIPIETLASGLYYVRIQSGSHWVSGSFVVVR
ncbi:MAG: PQQ-dependent sugar dehydrogenase [Bacteroidetes bacterium]|nr:PQQ-dependent sugar dehydrogenase [Bacteroidota bacterium]